VRKTPFLGRSPLLLVVKINNSSFRGCLFSQRDRARTSRGKEKLIINLKVVVLFSWDRVKAWNILRTTSPLTTTCG
jgi:hypothetical protein